MVTAELRSGFHHRLDQIDATMVRLFAIVTEGIGAATDAVLNGDNSAVIAMAHQDEVVGALWAEVEDTAQTLLALQNPVSGDRQIWLPTSRPVGLPPSPPSCPPASAGSSTGWVDTGWRCGGGCARPTSS